MTRMDMTQSEILAKLEYLREAEATYLKVGAEVPIATGMHHLGPLKTRANIVKVKPLAVEVDEE